MGYLGEVPRAGRGIKMDCEGKWGKIEGKGDNREQFRVNKWLTEPYA